MEYESISPEQVETPTESHIESLSLLDKFGKDDILLLGLIIILLTDNSCEDKSILVILAFLFLTGLS